LVERQLIYALATLTAIITNKHSYEQYTITGSKTWHCYSFNYKSDFLSIGLTNEFIQQESEEHNNSIVANLSLPRPK
jgi:hypothetical protein